MKPVREVRAIETTGTSPFKDLNLAPIFHLCHAFQNLALNAYRATSSIHELECVLNPLRIILGCRGLAKGRAQLIPQYIATWVGISAGVETGLVERSVGLEYGLLRWL